MKRIMHDGDNCPKFFTALAEEGVTRKLFNAFIEEAEEGLDYMALRHYEELLTRQDIYFSYDLDCNPCDIYFITD